MLPVPSGSPAALAEDFALTITAQDPAGGLRLVTELELTGPGVLRQRHTLSNTGSTGCPRTGAASVRGSTLALYRLLAELKTRHLELETQSCASGGARLDMGILEHTDRIWTSDCIDPLERLDNQANTGLLVPYELPDRVRLRARLPAAYRIRRSCATQSLFPGTRRRG
ncbi:alpha-galactosidase [Specibacter sp. NPDC057265]|uniref:alpha-galactosidase n=1 Tax=Specibacter sp. NPDC057265 TaxID=3346075 RepID=UPI00362EFEC4